MALCTGHKIFKKKQRNKIRNIKIGECIFNKTIGTKKTHAGVLLRIDILTDY